MYPALAAIEETFKTCNCIAMNTGDVKTPIPPELLITPHEIGAMKEKINTAAQDVLKAQAQQVAAAPAAQSVIVLPGYVGARPPPGGYPPIQQRPF